MGYGILAFPVSLTDQGHQRDCLYHSVQLQGTVQIHCSNSHSGAERRMNIPYSPRSLFCHSSKVIHPHKVTGKLKCEPGL